MWFPLHIIAYGPYGHVQPVPWPLRSAKQNPLGSGLSSWANIFHKFVPAKRYLAILAAINLPPRHHGGCWMILGMVYHRVYRRNMVVVISQLFGATVFLDKPVWTSNVGIVAPTHGPAVPFHLWVFKQTRYQAGDRCNHGLVVRGRGCSLKTSCLFYSNTIDSQLVDRCTQILDKNRGIKQLWKTFAFSDLYPHFFCGKVRWSAAVAPGRAGSILFYCRLTHNSICWLFLWFSLTNASVYIGKRSNWWTGFHIKHSSIETPASVTASWILLQISWFLVCWTGLGQSWHTSGPTLFCYFMYKHLEMEVNNCWPYQNFYP